MLNKFDLILPSYKEIYPNEDLTMQIGGLPLSDAKILITGAQGMLGNAIATALCGKISEEIHTPITIYLSSRSWNNTNVKTNHIGVCNCLKVLNSEIATMEEEFDLVIHTASPSNITKITSFEDLDFANSGILRDILNSKPRKIVFISTGEVYRDENLSEGESSSNFSIDKKRDWYAISKLKVEEILKEYESRTTGVATSIRLFHTFGPGLRRNDGRSFSDILWGAVINDEVVLNSPGNQIRSFLYLADAVDGILRIAFSDSPHYQTINLGSPNPISIKEFAQEVCKASGAKLTFALNESFQHSPNNVLVPKISRIHEFGWQERFGLIEAIQLTLKWIKNSTQMRNQH